MKKRNNINMYIDYDKSYHRRGRRGRGIAYKVLLVFILASGLGIGSYYVIKRQVEIENPGGINRPGSQDQVLEDQATDKGNNIGTEDTQSGTGQELVQNEGPGKEVTSGETTEGQKADVKPSQKILEEWDNRIPLKVKGIYVTSKAAGKDNLEELLKVADTTEINAMVIDVKDDNGKITYAMDSKLAKEIGAITNTIPDMEGLLKTLKEHGIYAIARVVAFKDPYLADHRHELALKNKDGSIYRDNKGECWINPYNREVWEYLVEVASQTAVIGFNEVQFDYIRFSTGGGMSEVDFGDEAETMTKEDIIIEFTKYAYEKLKPLGIFVSADVYGTIISSSIDAGLVGQNYVEMSKYLDYICPMIYPSHFGEGNYGVEYPDLEPFKIVRKVLTASRTKLEQIPDGEHRAIVRPWLQDFTATWVKKHMEYGGPELREQINGVYGANYQEWLLWDAACTYSVEGLLPE